MQKRIFSFLAVRNQIIFFRFTPPTNKTYKKDVPVFMLQELRY